jgi:hypothetical protein
LNFEANENRKISDEMNSRNTFSSVEISMLSYKRLGIIFLVVPCLKAQKSKHKKGYARTSAYSFV